MTAREAMAEGRAAGFYRVKRARMPEEFAWTVGEWDDDAWWLIGDREPYEDDTFIEIGERIAGINASPITRAAAAPAEVAEAPTDVVAAVSELRAAWVDICQHTPSTYTCDDWSRMTSAVDTLVEIVRGEKA